VNGSEEVKQFCIYSSDSSNSIVVAVVVVFRSPTITRSFFPFFFKVGTSLENAKRHQETAELTFDFSQTN